MKKSHKKIYSFMIAGLLLLSLVAVNFKQVSAVTYGQIDTANNYANVGAIVLSFPGEGNFVFCSGTMVGERELLTAGHCTYFLSLYIAGGYFNLENVKVSFDPLDPTMTAGLLDTEALITHPDFHASNANATADVGILILAKSPGIKPAKLAPVGLLDQLSAKGPLFQTQSPGSFTVIGYGASLNWPPPVVDFDQSGRAYAGILPQSLTPEWLQINQNPVVGSGGICFGDSGGPTVWNSPDGVSLVVGVNSWVGAVNCIANGYSSRIDKPNIQTFISSVLAQY